MTSNCPIGGRGATLPAPKRPHSVARRGSWAASCRAGSQRRDRPALRRPGPIRAAVGQVPRGLSTVVNAIEPAAPVAHPPVAPFRLGVDLDGVLTEHPRPLAYAAAEQFGIDLPERAFVDSAGLNVPEAVRDWVYGPDGPASRLATAPGAVAFIRDVQAVLGAANVVIITARPAGSARMTTDWLASHGFPPVEVFFADDKVTIARRQGCAATVEDSARHARNYAAAGIDCYLLPSGDSGQPIGPMAELTPESATHIIEAPDLGRIAGWVRERATLEIGGQARGGCGGDRWPAPAADRRQRPAPPAGPRAARRGGRDRRRRWDRRRRPAGGGLRRRRAGRPERDAGHARGDRRRPPFAGGGASRGRGRQHRPPGGDGGRRAGPERAGRQRYLSRRAHHRAAAGADPQDHRRQRDAPHRCLGPQALPAGRPGRADGRHRRAGPRRLGRCPAAARLRHARHRLRPADRAGPVQRARRPAGRPGRALRHQRHRDLPRPRSRRRPPGCSTRRASPGSGPARSCSTSRGARSSTRRRWRWRYARGGCRRRPSMSSRSSQRRRAHYSGCRTSW